MKAKNDIENYFKYRLGPSTTVKLKPGVFPTLSKHSNDDIKKEAVTSHEESDFVLQSKSKNESLDSTLSESGLVSTVKFKVKKIFPKKPEIENIDPNKLRTNGTNSRYDNYSNNISLEDFSNLLSELGLCQSKPIAKYKCTKYKTNNKCISQYRKYSKCWCKN